MIVVSNTSPIINLAAVEQLQLLQRMYGKVLIPHAVFHEIAVIGAGEPGAAEVQTYPWIETRRVANLPLATTLQMELDAGEAEAIALAVELPADLVLLDERRGRAAASRLGLHVVGLLGILVAAKHQGYLPAVQPVMRDLMTHAGFWIGKELYAQVLRAAGE